MPETRCDAVLLGCCVLCGFLLLGDVQARSKPEKVDAEVSTIFKGSYSGNAPGKPLLEGVTRVQLITKPSGIEKVRTTGMIFRMETGVGEQELAVTGLYFAETKKVVFQFLTEPTHFDIFGHGLSRICRVEGYLDLSGDAGQRSASGEIKSTDCDYRLRVNAQEIDVQHLRGKVLHYSILCDLVSMIQIRVFLAQIHHTDSGHAEKVSLLCIAMMALSDAYESFLHLSLGLNSQYMFNTFAVVALFKFLLFSLLEVRYLLVVWKARRQDAFSQGWEQISRELSWLYSRFYGILMVGLVIVYNLLPVLQWIVFLFQFFWVPQIVLDVVKGQRNSLSPYFIVGMATTRLIVPFYIWGCPDNIFTGDVYPTMPMPASWLMCSLFFSAQAVQVAVLFSQRRFGPRWFVPWICLPHVYNYYKGIQVDVEHGPPECVICMVELDPEDKKHCITPCDHAFHMKCLETWMDVKMECPTCRAVLPPLS